MCAPKTRSLKRSVIVREMGQGSLVWIPDTPATKHRSNPIVSLDIVATIKINTVLF